MTTAARRPTRAPESAPKDDTARETVWRSVVAAVVSGLFLVAAFPRLDQGWLAWFALVPMLMTYPHVRVRAALGQAFLFAWVYYGGLLAWLVPFAGHQLKSLGLGFGAWAIATFAQTLVMLVFAAGAQLLARRRGEWPWLLGIPALWTLLEWVRQLGPLGDGWGDLAYSQHGVLPVIQIVRVTGVWGLSFLIAMVGAILAALPVLRPRHCLIPALLLLGSFGYAAYAVRHADIHPNFVAAALQPNISPNGDWVGTRAGTDAFVTNAVTRYVAQADAAAQRGARLVVWPETSFPGYLRTDPGLAAPVVAAAVRNRQAMLIGSNERMPSVNRDANSLILLRPDGTFGGSYSKRQLVPFGEYVPRFFAWLSIFHLTIYDRFRGADRQALLDTGSPAGPVAASICYESSYPRFSHEQVARGAGVLVVVSDDTWFGLTPAGDQHADIAVLRAVESDRYLVRAAPTGISEIIDPTGRVLDRSDLFVARPAIAMIEARHTMPPYNRFGDWFIWAVGILALVAANGCLATGRKSS